MNDKEIKIAPHLGEEKGNFLTEWVFPLLLAIVFFLIFNNFFGISRVSGESMWPTLNEGNIVLVNKSAYFTQDPEPGDIVIFHSSLENDESLFQDTKDLIKRVIAVGGDHVVVSDGNVYVNDVKLKEDYLAEGMFTIQDVDMIVPDGYFFCMGDNRLNSLDSRYPQVGPIAKEDFVGKVFYQFSL